jgi:hypothetical protein
MREIMDKEEGTGTVVEIGATRRRKAPARRTAAAKRTARPATRRKAPVRRKAASSGFEGMIRSIAESVSVARAAIAEASGQGATAVRRAYGTASKASRKTVTRMANEWKAMDPKKKAGILAALLGAAAAASAPLVRKSLKK